MKTLLLVAGDPSGDMHGADLIRALKQVEPTLKTAAVGGALMRREADDFLEDLASLGVAGFWEPVRRLPFFWNLRQRIKKYLLCRKPDALICIDFYGFNRWVLEAAREAQIPAYYYVSPQVWASRPGRIHALRRLVRRMFVIFPFEEKIYRDAQVPATFVGHPLLDRLPEPIQRDGTPKPLKIGLLPGSRSSEVSRHLPLFLDALELLRKDYPSLTACVFAAPSLPDSFYSDALRRGVRLVREPDYALRSRLDLALSSSGTATLENALLGVPMIVVYRMSRPTYWIARSLIRVPYISMVNLLAGRALVPELIQQAATPKCVAQAALNLLGDPQKLERLRHELLSLRELLGNPGAASRTAKAILQELQPAQEPAAVTKGRP
jgi:lipid-A-disaccharide synthase